MLQIKKSFLTKKITLSSFYLKYKSNINNKNKIIEFVGKK